MVQQVSNRFLIRQEHVPVREPDRPMCVCGHPPVLHGNPEIFGSTNTICLVAGCYCRRYLDRALENKERTG